MSNTAHAIRITDLLPDADAPGFGQAMLRLAEMAAALHRADVGAASTVEPWSGLTTQKIVESDDSHTQDKVEHGSLAVTRSARDCDRGTVTTEGDR